MSITVQKPIGLKTLYLQITLINNTYNGSKTNTFKNIILTAYVNK